jgi:cytochrome d ubiquinol oxidase subunit I
MKIAASEALWNTEQPASFSLFQIGGFTASDPTPTFSIEIPDLLSFLSTESFHGKVVGLNQLNKQYERLYGRGNYEPPVRSVYWAMRVMAYAGSLVALVALVGAVLYRRHRLERTRWFLRLGVATIFLPFLSCAAGWVLTEVGRQPWIVQGLLKTAQANSPSVSATWLGVSLAVFVSLYVALLVVDFWLMRRYATVDPAGEQEEPATPPDAAPVVTY